ncbi:hypothetical protein CDL12_24722 [Handroanthus impetiginosus]|uniref:Retrotransposon gag domain-containing protein n=1 Tax=Handroanthus impetiginosus TaxID=429701 RepID=A0A2G9GCQ3_9LAMI|nr:hypothetical protein CDL12_24722 [Handroanthus impetiginosus]
MSVEPFKNITTPSMQHDVNSEMRATSAGNDTKGVAFDEDILAEPIPSNYRPPGIPEYHGTTDPTLHLRRFQTAALLYQYLDKLKYQVFVNTFGEDAQLCSKHFRKTLFTLYNVRQADDESLREYMRRFTAAVLEVPGAYKEVLANSFVNSLTEGSFFATLITDLEAVKIKRADREKRKEKKEEIPAPKKSKPEGQERNPSFTQQMDQFTPLKVPRSQVLMEIRASNLLKRPFRASQGPTKPKSDKFCQFHNDYGHDTDEYAHLRNEIEKLIKKGHLREFITLALPSAPPQKETIANLQTHQRKGIIHMISREVNAIESGSPAPIIQFSIPDLEGVDYPHEDALVITVTIVTYDVARVFINCGSSVDILFLKAFQIIRFLIVDMPSTYNIILGRPMLNLFQAVPSTYHQKIKYLVEDQVGKVRAIRISDDNWGPGPIDKSGQKLEEERLEEFINLLRINRDVFAFSVQDLRGIDPDVMVHRLNVDLVARPVK